MLFCFRQRVEVFAARTTWKLFILDVFALRYTWVIFHIVSAALKICNRYATVETVLRLGARIGMAFALLYWVALRSMYNAGGLLPDGTPMKMARSM